MDETPVTLTSEFGKDIAWWVEHMEGWNGRSFLLPTHTAHIAVDASAHGWYGPQPGLGANNMVSNQFFSCRVPERCRDWAISELELLTHVLACHVWSHDWDRAVVTIMKDKEVMRWLLTNGRSHHPGR